MVRLEEVLEELDADRCYFQTCSVTWPGFILLSDIVSFPGSTYEVVVSMNCPLDTRVLWSIQVTLPASRLLSCHKYARVLLLN